MHSANRRRLYPGDGRLAAPAGHPEWPSVFLVSRKPATPGKTPSGSHALGGKPAAPTLRVATQSVAAVPLPRGGWERGRAMELLPLDDFGVRLLAVQVFVGLADHVANLPSRLLDADGRIVGELPFQFQRLALDLEPVFKVGERPLDLV